jgi:hypothetical protein
MRNKNSKFKISDFGGFQSAEVRKKKVKIARLHLWFPLCSETYRRMIKHLYFISASSPDLAKPS